MKYSNLYYIPLILGLGGCAGFKSATPVSLDALTANPSLAADVGYTNSTGVPSVSERFAERPGLKLAIVQVAYGIKGRPEMTFTSDVWSFGGVSTWKTTTTPEIMVPASYALASARNATRAVEDALAAKGFDVIPHEQIAKTPAYTKHYGEYGGYFLTEAGFTFVPAPGMRIKAPEGVIDYAWLGQVWPDAEALADIKKDVGQDVLLLCLRYDIETFAGGGSGFTARASLLVADPDFAGYGIGGFGHNVTIFDAVSEPTALPGFVERDGKQWKVSWTPVFEAAVRIHRGFAQGFATELSKMTKGEG